MTVLILIFLWHLMYFMMPIVSVTFSVAWVIISLTDMLLSNSEVIKSKSGNLLLGVSLYTTFLFSFHCLVIYMNL